MLPIRNNEGSALLMALLILLVVTVIGVSSMRTSSVEVKIASNDRLYKTSFYAAEGGTEVGRELVEQNLACATGFSSDVISGKNSKSVKLTDRRFAFKETPPAGDYPSDSEYDIRWPDDTTVPHTNVVAYGNTELSTGSAIQMAAGYEGRGKGAAGGGAQIIYNIYSRHQGRQKSTACIRVNYRHVIGQEGPCKY